MERDLLWSVRDHLVTGAHGACLWNEDIWGVFIAVTEASPGPVGVRGVLLGSRKREFSTLGQHLPPGGI